MIPRTHLVIVIFILLASSVLSVPAYFHLSAQVPTHWNWRGQADQYGPTWMELVILPACSWLLMALLVLVPRLGPFRSNFTRFARAYGRICVTLAFSLFVIHVVVVLKAAGRSVPIERALPVIAGLTIATVGNWMGKIRRNAYVGFRTPWTLANDDVWEQTNRVGARIGVIFGLAVALSSPFMPPLITIVFIVGGAILIAVWAMAYSYRLYRVRGTANDSA